MMGETIERDGWIFEVFHDSAWVQWVDWDPMGEGLDWRIEYDHEFGWWFSWSDVDYPEEPDPTMYGWTKNSPSKWLPRNWEIM